MITAVWAFIKSPIGLRIVGALAVVLALFALYQVGVSHGVAKQKADEARRVAAATKVIRKVEKHAEAITAKTDAKTAERVVEIRTVTKTLTKEIPVYVTAEADRVAVLPVGLIRLHNQAALGVSQVPADPGFVSDAPSGVAASAFGGVIVANYGIAYEWKERAVACESWAVQQAELWDKSIKTVKP